MALSLRRLTSDAHRSAEAAVLATGLFDSRPRYAAYLASLLPFYRAVEPLLVVHLSPAVSPAFDGLAIDQRRKEPLLARDLERIGGTAALDAGRARMAFVPAIRTTPAALGAAYVLEGKTLGARFLLEEARARLGLGPQHGAAFLAGYGAETSARWTTYRSALEEYVRAKGCRRVIVEAARATFEAFTRTVAVVPF